MRKKILAGNWKMNTNIADGLDLFEAVKLGWKGLESDGTLCVIAPPSTHLFHFESDVDSHIYLSAQNCSEYEKGAFTGEISAEMVRSTGASFVIVGHSERRMNFKENNEILKQKIDLALKYDLTPIYCCGETEREREENLQRDVVKSQLEEGLYHLESDDFGKVVVAYEPVWAIGTGKTATSDQAQDMHYFIRNTIKDRYDQEIAGNTSILYGGSCNPQNAKELFANEDVDGGLIGGASLQATDFIEIAKILEG